MDKKMSDEFNELLKQGYSFDSPEMLNFFEKNVRTRAKSPYNTSNNYSSNEQSSSSYSNTSSSYNRSANETETKKVRTRAKSPYNTSNNYSSNEQSSSSYSNTSSSYNRSANETETKKVRTRSKSPYNTSNNYSSNEQSSKSYSSTSNNNSTYKAKSKTTTKAYTEYTTDQRTKSKTTNDSKFHIVIDPYKGDYTLLNSSLQTIDTIHKNFFANIITRRFNLSKFKRQLNKDYRAYKRYCKKNHIALDPNFKEVNNHIKYCLSLCPDADYQILELLRKNIKKVAPSYGNYQTACAQYLHELAVDFPYPSRMPFDLNYACDKLTSNHRHIANTFGCSENPVNSFRKAYVRTTAENNVKKEYLKTPNTDVVPPKKSLDVAKSVKAPNSHDDR